MRTYRIGTALVLPLALLLCGAAQAMEDPVTATPETYKILHENEQIRVLEVVYQTPRRSAERLFFALFASLGDEIEQTLGVRTGVLGRQGLANDPTRSKTF